MSSQSEANNRWRKKNRAVLQLTITHEDKKMIEYQASRSGKSMTAYIMELVKGASESDMDSDAGEKRRGSNPHKYIG